MIVLPFNYYFHFLIKLKNKFIVHISLDPVGIAICRQGPQKNVFPGLASKPQPPACKSVALLTDLPGKTVWSRVCSYTAQ